MARMDGKRISNGQTLKDCSAFFTEALGSRVLLEGITHRREVEKPPVLENAAGAQGIFFRFKTRSGQVRRLNIVLSDAETVQLVLRGSEIPLAESETNFTRLTLPLVCRGELVADPEFRMRLLEEGNHEIVSVGIGSSPILVTLTGSLDSFQSGFWEAELRRSYMDIPSL